jgi:hypothetical protein
VRTERRITSLGFVQLAEAVRFDDQWKWPVGLGLRRGELAALDEYYDHGRITGAKPDQALDDARARYGSRPGGRPRRAPSAAGHAGLLKTLPACSA